jgi:excisionase family DNA binding protein
MTDATRDLMTIEEFAAATRQCTRTVRRHIANGRITAVRVGGKWLIARDSLDVIRALAGSTQTMCVPSDAINNTQR